jgi:transcriptional regulator with XRE-family HTH domain
MLAKVTGLSPANLSEDLIERDGLNILYENIHYLINTLPHGQKKEFAKRLGIDVTTVSRWVSSAHRPAKKKQDEICQYFSLPAGTNLETEAVFLWTDPVSEAQMKTWLIESINFLDVNFLRLIFPALKRLLKRQFH